MTAGLKLLIDSDLASVATVARAVRSVCVGIFPVSDLDEIEIAVVEAINNVIQHGYGGRRGRDVELQLCLRPEEAVIEIIDHALPMQPGLITGIAEDPFQFDMADRGILARRWGSPSSVSVWTTWPIAPNRVKTAFG